MASKKYDAGKAIDPAQEQKEGGEMNFQEFVASLPEEFQAEIEEALAALLSFVHSDEGTAKIIEDLQAAKGNEAAQVGITALQTMDEVDPEHAWSDSAKVLAGYFAVKEVAEIGRAAGIIDVPEEMEGKIFQQAAQNYLHAIIKNKPTQEEREAEAIRIQKEVEPLLTEKMRQAGRGVAKEHGIPTGEEQAPRAAQQGGLLE